MSTTGTARVVQMHAKELASYQARIKLKDTSTSTIWTCHMLGSGANGRDVLIFQIAMEAFTSGETVEYELESSQPDPQNEQTLLGITSRLKT